MKEEYKNKVKKLQERFNRVITDSRNLGIKVEHSHFFIEEEQEHIRIIIDMNMATENGYEDKYRTIKTTEYTDLTAAENLIEILEKVQMISRYSEHHVLLMPRNYSSDIPFDIYIDGQLTRVNDLNTYVKSINTEIDSKITKAFSEISLKAPKIFQLYAELEMNQNTINHYHDLVEKLNDATSTFEKFKILGQNNSELNPPRHMRINGYVKEQEINWDKIFSIRNNHAYSTYIQQQQMIAQYNEIIQNIQLGGRISNNMLTFPRDFTMEELHVILNFLESISNLLDKIEQEYTQKIEATSKTIKEIDSTIESALSSKKKSDVIDTISSMKISKEEPINTPSAQKEDTYIGHKEPIDKKNPFQAEIAPTSTVIEELRRQQLEKLTQEERDALFCYKSLMYAPINEITGFLRMNQIELSEIENNETMYNQLITIISKHYTRYFQKEIQAEKKQFSREDYGKVENRIFGKTLTREEYIKLVLKSIPHLKSALSKIETPEDIVVYRGVNSTKPTLTGDGRFLSTSLKIEVAKEFLESEDRKKTDEYTQQEIYQIFIPKGSPVIAFTKDLYVEKSHYDFGRYTTGTPYLPESDRSGRTEEQFEIIIDPSNFDFQELYYNYHQNTNGEVVHRHNVIAQPKAYTIIETEDKSRH